eukprot:scaffold3084_cov144-Cylindrotheca_fusiformis.AAC.79
MRGEEIVAASAGKGHFRHAARVVAKSSCRFPRTGPMSRTWIDFEKMQKLICCYEYSQQSKSRLFACIARYK